VAAVAAANPNTVVVVNSGSPVLMPWRDEVAAVLLGYFGGEQFGNAVADVLLGVVEPGGRLPTTWPAVLEDVPVLNCTPDDAGRLSYDEGIHIGYRAWLKAGRTPAYPFGHGLSYTSWSVDGVAVEAEGADPTVRVEVANTGDRAGKQVVQIYASRSASAVERPERWLVGFAPVRLEAGARSVVEIAIPRRRFAHFDGGWQVEAGTYTLHVGSSVVETWARVEIDL